MAAQVHQTLDTSEQMARFQRQMDAEQQEARIRQLTNKEAADRNMRYQWRKNCENDYEA